MLKQRVLTAIVMAVVGLTALFGLGSLLFSMAALILFVTLGGWEAARLAGVTCPMRRGAYVALLSLPAAALLIGGAEWLSLLGEHTTDLINDQTDPQRALMVWLVPGCLAWIGFIVWLSRPDWGRQASRGMLLFKLAALAVLLWSAWLAVCWLQAQSPWWVLLLIVVIAAADIGAYFSGRAIGGPKLAPRISPGKTRSGAIGGLLASAGLTALAAWLLPDVPFTPLQALPLAILLALVSIGGDLFISLLKRQQGLKDTSALFPGHGGVLDRFDSLSAALPFFAVLLIWLSSPS
ncbi:MAG: phosphatidate cytidylyltransferase [Wenzhouxiangella sp.]